MRRRAGVFAFVDDPFDPPGARRFGGGQALSFELGRWLVRSGFDVTYVTHLNAPAKSSYEGLGPVSRIYRIATQNAEYLPGENLAMEIDKLYANTEQALIEVPDFDIIHALYWVSGAVALWWQKQRAASAPVILHPISFGRFKHGRGPHTEPTLIQRERIEPDVLANCQTVVVGSPEERDRLVTNYPEVSTDQILLAPLWYDDDVFQPRPEPADTFVRRASRRFTEGA